MTGAQQMNQGGSFVKKVGKNSSGTRSVSFGDMNGRKKQATESLVQSS